MTLPEDHGHPIKGWLAVRGEFKGHSETQPLRDLKVLLMMSSDGVRASLLTINSRM